MRPTMDKRLIEALTLALAVNAIPALVMVFVWLA